MPVAIQTWLSTTKFNMSVYSQILFDSDDQFLHDAMRYCRRCEEVTGDKHILFLTGVGGYECRHFRQTIRPDSVEIFNSSETVVI